MGIPAPSLGATFSAAFRVQSPFPLASRSSPRSLRVIANVNLTDRSRSYAGSITDRQSDFVEFRLDRTSDLRVELLNRSSGTSNSRRIQVRLRRGSQTSTLFTTRPGNQERDRIRLNSGNYRIELKTFSRNLAQYTIRLNASSVSTSRRIDLGNITGERRTENRSINRNAPVDYIFRLSRTREVEFDLQNRLEREFFDFLGERNISANLFGSGVREPLFSTSPGDRDTEFVRLRSGSYRLELRATRTSNIPYRFRLIG